MSNHDTKQPGRADKAGGAAPDAAEAEQAPQQSRDPREAKWHAMVRAATAYNQQHPDKVAEFNRLTDGKCAGQNAGLSVREVKRWQMDRGLPTDGKIGPRTLQAAQREAKPGTESNVIITEAEAQKDAAAKPEEPEDALAEALESGEGGVKERETGNPYEGASLGSDIIEHTVEDMAEDAGKAGKVAGKVAGKALLIPEIVSLLRAHQWDKALRVVTKSVGAEDRIEIVKKVVETLAGELAPRVLTFFEHLAVGGFVFDVLQLGYEWFKLGIESIHEAHVRGDRDSANAIFAWAYAETLLTGRHSNPGAVTAQEVEAKQIGIELGKQARAECPELPILLKVDYGDGDNARRAIEDGLLALAGINLRTHSGR